MASGQHIPNCCLVSFPVRQHNPSSVDLAVKPVKHSFSYADCRWECITRGRWVLTRDGEGLEDCSSILEAIQLPDVRDITDVGKGCGRARKLDIWKSSFKYLRGPILENKINSDWLYLDMFQVAIIFM